MDASELRGHLVLVGLMGTGKSTVGRRLADILDRPLHDSDEMIEARTGTTVREIFVDQSEAAFRAVETAVLLDALAAETPSVIAAAGGIVLRRRTAGRCAPMPAGWCGCGPDPRPCSPACNQGSIARCWTTIRRARWSVWPETAMPCTPRWPTWWSMSTISTSGA